MAAEDLSHLGITDLEQKHALICRRADGAPPRFTLLWRTMGPRGKPLPKIGARLRVPGGFDVIVERIDPPGTPLSFPKEQKTLIVTPHTPTAAKS